MVALLSIWYFMKLLKSTSSFTHTWTILFCHNCPETTENGIRTSLHSYNCICGGYTRMIVSLGIASAKFLSLSLSLQRCRPFVDCHASVWQCWRRQTTTTIIAGCAANNVFDYNDNWTKGAGSLSHVEGPNTNKKSLLNTNGMAWHHWLTD